MLENISCNYIKVTSPVLTAMFEQLEEDFKIAVSLTKNCCTEVHSDYIEDTENTDWTVKLFKQTDEDAGVIVINGFYVKNIITGIETKISNEFTYGDQGCTAGFSATETAIEDYFTDIGFAVPTFSHSVDADGYCIFTVSGLDYPFVMTRVNYTAVGGSNKDRLFQYAATSYGLFLSGEDLYITPGIYQDSSITSFSEGIYTAQITYTDNTGNSVTETTCLFMDCGIIKCRIADKLATLTTDSTMHIIYFALLEASNCGCQCDKLCNLYQELLVLLGDLTSSTSVCNECT